MKLFYEQFNIGLAKYVISFHNGESKHKDGSDFYDIRIFKNKPSKQAFISELLAQGYSAR